MKRQFRIALAGGVLALLALAPSAYAATSVSGVTTQFSDGNSNVVTSPTAGVNYNYDIVFTATSGLAPNDTITVTGPPGTVFRHDNPGQTIFFNVLVPGHSGSSSTSAPTITDGGQTITVTVPTLDFISPGYTVPAGGLVSLDFVSDSASPYVTSPTLADQYTLSVATSKDTVAADSPPYTVGPDVPANMGIVGGSGQSTQAGTAFATVLKVGLSDQYGNAVGSGQSVTFDAPGSGPSGTFAGGTNGGTEFVATTGSNGVAAAPVLTANTIAGGWVVSASGPNATGASLSLTTVHQAASQVSLVLAHPSLPADRTSKTKATATIADQFGNPVSSDNVVISSSDGGQLVTSTSATGSGHYEATITTSGAAGASTITATDNSVAPALTGTAEMTQIDVTPPAVKITKAPAKRSRAKTAKIIFRSPATDVAHFLCKLDKRSYATCKSPKSYSVAVGKHTISVRALDQAGNIGAAVSASFRRLPPKKKHHHH